MVGLDKMPNQILIEVFKNLTRERAALRCLATMNKKLSVIAIQTLAHSIDICVQTEDNALSRRYDLLMASLNRAPDLGLFPREITIRCEKRGENRRRSEHPNIRANILLRRLPKIQSMSIDWHDDIYVFSPAYLEHMENCRLEQITFLTDQTQLDHIGAFKTAASLSSIVAKNLDPTSTLSLHLLSPNPAGRASPNLKLMDLGRSHLHYKNLPKLFQMFPAITSLDCAVPFRELFFYARHNWKATSPPASFIGKAFAPLQECLASLRLNYGTETLLFGADDSEIDFNDFRCLKVLHVPSTGYFRDSPEYQRNGMRKLLPPSLEEFKISFDFGQHFLCATRDELPLCFINGHYSDHIEVTYPRRYEWLSELIGANLSDPDNSRLRKVMVEERVLQIKKVCYHVHLWKSPSALHQLCNDAEVTLEVRLRKPIKFSNSDF